MPAFRWLMVEPDPALRKLLERRLHEVMSEGLRKEVEIATPEVSEVESLLYQADEDGGHKFDLAMIAGRNVPLEDILPALDAGLEGHALVVSISVDPRVGERLMTLERPFASVPKNLDVKEMASKIIGIYCPPEEGT